MAEKDGNVFDRERASLGGQTEGRGRHQEKIVVQYCLSLSGKTTEEELPLKLADKFHNKDVVRRGEKCQFGGGNFIPRFKDS